MTMPRIVRAVAILLAIGVQPLMAQATPDSVKHRNDCRLATQVVETGNPAPHRDWALSYILSCGQAGVTAIVHQWDRVKSSEDTAALGELIRWIGNARHPDLMSQFISTGTSSTASTAARVVSWKMLLRHVSPAATLDEVELERRPVSALCAVGYISGSQPRVLAQLPAGFMTTIRDAAASTESDVASPDRVRRAAHCVKQYAEFALNPVE